MAATASWRQRAACAGMDVGIFYDPDPAVEAAAKAVCRRCPVRADCAAHARDTREFHGVWGGLNEHERARRHGSRPPGSGPPPVVSDDELVALFEAADPDEPAIGVLRTAWTIAPATAYKYLERARRLGLVEARGRYLYPAR